MAVGRSGKSAARRREPLETQTGTPPSGALTIFNPTTANHFRRRCSGGSVASAAISIPGWVAGGGGGLGLFHCHVRGASPLSYSLDIVECDSFRLATAIWLSKAGWLVVRTGLSVRPRRPVRFHSRDIVE